MRQPVVYHVFTIMRIAGGCKNMSGYITGGPGTASPATSLNGDVRYPITVLPPGHHQHLQQQQQVPDLIAKQMTSHHYQQYQHHNHSGKTACKRVVRA